MGYIVYEMPELRNAPPLVRKSINELCTRLEQATDLSAGRSPPTFDPLGRGYFKKRLTGNLRLIARLLCIDAPSGKVAVVLLLDVVGRDSKAYADAALQAIRARYEPEVRRRLPQIEQHVLNVARRAKPPDLPQLPPLPAVLQEVLKPTDVHNPGMAFFVPEQWRRVFCQLEEERSRVMVHDILKEIADANDVVKQVLNRSGGDCRIEYLRIPIGDSPAPHVFLLGLYHKSWGNEHERHMSSQRDKLHSRILQVLSEDDPERQWDGMSKLAERTFPDYLLADDRLWQSIWEEREVFLTLSTEELRILQALCAGRGLPGIIEGRAGSGKSTLLFYFAAEQLCRACGETHAHRVPLLYLTQSGRLLEKAKQLIEALTQRRVQEKTIGQQQAVLAEAVYLTYHGFALQQLSSERAQRFVERRRQNEGGWVDFNTFRDLLRGHGKYGFRGAFRESDHANPEVVWFILRSYIKGFKINDIGEDRWMTAEEYAEPELVARRDRQVSQELYWQVWEHVWPWYRRLTIPCAENEGTPPYWDDLDLAWEVLLNRRHNAPDFALLVCDEVQDFTRVELAALLGCLSWRRYDYSSLEAQSAEGVRLPIVLAGDAHQTVNPSCFRWARVRTDLANALVCHLPHATLPEVAAEELACNYRNAAGIGRLCNALQQLRQERLGHLGRLQDLWRVYDDQPNQRIRRLQPFLDAATSVKSLLNEGVFLIGPEEDDPEIQTTRSFWQALGCEAAPENVPNYVTPAEIKGLEQDFVALVGFGTAFAQLGLGDFWNWQQAAEDERVSEAQRFAAEYFLNRLYVAVSRAREQLWIIETEEGWNAFWRKLEQWLNAEQAAGELQANVRLCYTDGSLSELIEVFKGNWLPLAKQLEEAAHDQKSPEHCERAAFYYKLAEKNTDGERMLAYQQYYRGDPVDAARRLWRIDPDTATDWFWQAEAWEELAQRLVRPPWKQHLAAIAARLLGKGSLPHSTPPAAVADKSATQMLLDTLQAVRQYMPSPADLLLWKPWNALHLLLLQSANNLPHTKVELRERVFDYTSSLVASTASHALFQEWYDPLAVLAYDLSKWHAAIDFWNRLKKTQHQRYFLAQAEISPYPQCLEWLESAGKDYAQPTVDAYHAHPGVQLDLDNRRRVARAASHIKDWKLALALIAGLDVKLAADVWAECASKLPLHDLQQLVDTMHEACSRIWDASELPRRWTQFLFDMLLESAANYRLQGIPKAHQALVYGFSRSVQPDSLTRRVQGSWELRRPGTELTHLKVLETIAEDAREWIKLLCSQGKTPAAANLAYLALNVVWRFEARRDRERHISQPSQQSSLRQYLQAETLSRSMNYLHQIAPHAHHLVTIALECVAAAPADFWNEAPKAEAIDLLNGCIDALSEDLRQHLSQTVAAAQTVEDYGHPAWWLLVAQFAERAPFRRRALDLYAELLKAADQAGWDAQVKEQIAARQGEYERLYSDWKRRRDGSRQPDHVLLAGKHALSAILQVARSADGSIVNIMVHPKQCARLRLTFAPAEELLRSEPDPELTVELREDSSSRQMWQVSCDNLAFSVVWYPNSRTLHIDADQRFEVVFARTQ